MLIRNLVAAAAAALATVPGAATAVPAPVRMQVWEIVRVSAAPSKFAVSASVGFVDSRSILAVTYLRQERSGLKVLPGASVSSHEGSTEPQLYAGGKRVSCTAAVGIACTTTKGVNMSVDYYHDGGSKDPAAPTSILVLTYGRDPQVSVAGDSKHWRVRKVSRAARVVWSSDGDQAAGAWTPYLGIEAFTGATLPGGKRGSVAIGVPPCSGSPVAVSSGAGSVTLAGGVKPVQASCPQDVMRPSQLARKATTWTLTGPVAGTTADQVSEPGTVRLIVIDL